MLFGRSLARWSALLVDANGCQLSLDHNFCENDFDQCACNGTSFCIPAAAAREGQLNAISGCSELNEPPNNWPCEAGGDGNVCTQEFCCEPNPGCIHLELGTQPPGSTVIAQGQPDGSCLLPLGTPAFIAGLVTRTNTSSTGASVECVRLEDFISGADRARIACDDGNPCTADACAPSADLTGPVCTNTALTGAPPPTVITVAGTATPVDAGCIGLTNQGCGARVCQAGGCAVTAAAGAGAGVQRPCGLVDSNQTCGCDGFAGLGPNNQGTQGCAPQACDGAGRCALGALDDGACADALTCTAEMCVFIPPSGDNPRGGGACGSVLIGGTCLIDGECFDALDERPGRPCEACIPDESRFEWRTNPSPSDPRPCPS